MMQLVAWWPRVCDKQWGYEDSFVAGAAFRGAVKAGFSEERAAMLAEAAGYKNIFKGLLYPVEVERDLRRCKRIN